ncbi:uncharacterized protein LOC128951851 [Oppia nitens]|uniref:uncharacterized protein LOC128951851 n=1 Tax=Oppia nitens TaxID=1686743 RepID=UPI0023DA6AD3|nr:uncharacterized protein LOC128951851 [Oppia nitens]
MGLDINRAIHTTIDDQFLCGICCGIIVSPKGIVNCGHVFCEQCITDWIATKHNCPHDRDITIELDCLDDVCDDYYESYEQIMIRCQNWLIGCDHIFSIVEDSDHQNGCHFNETYYRKCKCGIYVDKKDESHNCVDYLKCELKRLNINHTKAELLISELQLKLLYTMNECLKLRNQLIDTNTGHQISLLPEMPIDCIPEAKQLMDALKEVKVVNSSEVEQTLLAIDRQLFCPPNVDTDIDVNSPIIYGTILELLLETLQQRKQQSSSSSAAAVSAPVGILEIGCSTGYLSVCMAYMCQLADIDYRIVAIDDCPKLVNYAQNNLSDIFAQLINECDEKIKFLYYDGSDDTLPDQSEDTYDIIHLGRSVDELPHEMIARLKCSGRMTVAISGDRDKTQQQQQLQELITIDKSSDGQLRRRKHCNVWFRPLFDTECQ